ncbi:MULTISPECIES: serine protease [unclassified Pedobacter]|uniref:S1 family peptidase n=1 Tax=unclassified Pedobacter TaxID=2628915 RepID=UPI001420535E|nr:MULTISPECIES: serine protease [unclassified Pedobacter]NII82043.1 S1-C subfamily serine protease [Pedobacter sp. SG908]NMN36048.1 S1-C subfamily serine protease [Pedobacter sp. SG918]
MLATKTLKKGIGIATGIFLLAVGATYAQAFTDDAKILTAYQKSLDSLFLKVKTITSTDAQTQLAENTGVISLNLVKTNKKVKTGNEIYEYAKPATVTVGIAYLCPRCSNSHISESSGYVIDPKGIVVTNYHVAAMYANISDGNKPLGLTVRMASGKVYAIKSILACSKSHDLAVLELATDGEKIPALPLAQAGMVGDQVYVLGQPKGMHYFFSEGMVTNKYMEEAGEHDKKFFREMMAISADYATGSSGGPVMDSYGNVIGTVSNTKMFTHSEMNPSVQMVVKNTVPVEALWKLVRSGSNQ